MINWHSLSVEETLQKLQSSLKGLNSIQVSNLREIHGYNETPETHKIAWWRRLLNQFKSLLIIILFIAALISLITAHYVDMYIIVSVILINSLIGFFQEMRAERSMLALRKMMIISAKVIRNGERLKLEARELVPGDLIILEEGDSVPADARLIIARNLRAIEASLTGESVPVAKHINKLDNSLPLADQHNMVRKATFIAGGYGEAVVTATGSNTAIGKIARSIHNIVQPKSNFQRKINTLARQMAAIALVSTLVLFSVSYWVRDGNLEETLLVAIAALVSVIPEGLPAVLAIVLAIGANRMSRRNAIIRNFNSTETLGAVTTIITDKTGTLTQNTLSVRHVWISGSAPIEVSGEGWRPTGVFKRENAVITTKDEPSLRELLQTAAWCNAASIQHDTANDQFHLVGDPTEGAIHVLAEKGGISSTSSTNSFRLDDLPFNSDLKLRATLVNLNGSKKLMVMGAPEEIKAACSHVLTANGVQELSSEIISEIKNTTEQWSNQAMRVIALAYRNESEDCTQVDPENIQQLTFAGLAGMADPPRPDVKEAVAACKEAGIRVIMATGDHINTAVAIARETGIIGENESLDKYTALTQQQLDEMDENTFAEAVLNTSVLARLTPDMKLRVAKTLQQKNQLVAMTGDGVNDAPALKQADVGVAMGIMGTDVARDAADIVLADDKFSTIVHAIEEGRIVFNNARITSFFLVTTNFAEVVTLLTAVIVGVPIPLTATQLLWLNLVTDGVGDLSLATERGHGEILKQKPVELNENILSKEILPFLAINVAVMTVLTLGAFNYFLPISLEKGRSAAFIIMGFSQLFNVFNMRSIRLSVFKIGMFSNKYVNVALIISVLIQVAIIEIPFFEVLFRFDPISWIEFIVLASLASSVLWFGELYKLFSAKRKPAKRAIH